MIGRHLPINDHGSLKYLLERKISTSVQSRWLHKQLGLDYRILFRKGIGNLAAAAVSRFSNAQMLEITLSTIDVDLMKRVQASWA